MGILAFLKNTFSPGEKSKNEADFTRIIEAAYGEWKVKGSDYWSFKPHDNGVFNNRILRLTGKQKVAFITDSVHQIAQYNKGRTSWHSHDKGWQLQNIRDNFLQHLLKTKLALDEDDVGAIVNAFSSCNRHDRNNHIIFWPVNLLMNQVEKQFRDQPVSEKLKKILEFLREKIRKPTNSYHEKDQLKILGKIEALLFYGQNETDTIKPAFFPGKDDFGAWANTMILQMDESDRAHWFKLMLQSQKASGGRPAKKFLDESRTLFKEFGTDKFKHLVNEWFSFLIAMKEKTGQLVQRHNNRDYVFTATEFLAAANTDMIKGFVWMCVHFHDKNTLSNIATLAERSYRKIQGKGPAAGPIGNACLYVLAHVKGLDGIKHLSRLRLRIRQTTTQNLIEKYMLEAAAEHGLSIHEIEDMAVDNYGLEEGKKEYDFGNYKAVLKIAGVGKTQVSWLEADGTRLECEPPGIKQSHAAGLERIKNITRQIELTVSTQRDRLDRMLKCNRVIEWSQFVEFYFSHGLMCYLTDLLIWNFKREDREEAAFFLEDKWVNSCNEELSFPVDEDTLVSLWHPVSAAMDEVKRWQEFMTGHKIVQPFKQAFREIYLADAGTGTASSSTRMADHILKQQQFNSLTRARGWKYLLPGTHGNGPSNGIALADVADHELRAEFRVTRVNAENADGTGTTLYVSTGQLRFVNTISGHAVKLAEVPPAVFSEILRDVDLFIGTASIGNDPAWQDSGGLPCYMDYWQSYSFGELTELAKCRRSILEDLVPLLCISKVAELGDKFLVVKGKLRTYKIHIGSTNILMEPGDQYLCIVPERSLKNVPAGVFLPFEGDAGLSIVLNKAILLADDDKITDPAITRQLQYR
jgi:hypothetical protein